MFWDKSKEETESTVDSPEQAKNILGDESVESIASAIDEMVLVDPDEKKSSGATGAKRGRKPKAALPPDNEPTTAEIVFGETLVETQAIGIAAVIKAFSSTDSTIEIYKLHMQSKKKLAYAFAKVSREFGFEVTGKMAALAMLLTTEAGLIKDCWEVWEPKEENSDEKD